jgi:hypothetical protein
MPLRLLCLDPVLRAPAQNNGTCYILLTSHLPYTSLLGTDLWCIPNQGLLHSEGLHQSPNTPFSFVSRWCGLLMERLFKASHCRGFAS